jgi:hypothetical protein
MGARTGRGEQILRAAYQRGETANMAIVTEEVWTKGDFVDLARRQRQFLGIISLILIVNAAALFTPAAPQSLLRGVATLLSLAALYFVYKLVVAVLPASSTWIIIAYFVLSFIPLINLLLLAYVNRLAIKRLRLTGLRIGLLGAKLSDVEELREDFVATVTV